MLEQVDPQTLGFSPQRLKRVSSWLQDQIDDDRLAGASVMIGRRGKIALFDAVGEADKDAALAFSADTIVRIYSMTKAVTTVAAMMLYERGAFQLDDRVAQYLPGFAHTLVWTGGAIDSVEPQQTQMSIRHLMTHTSGLTYGFMHTNVVDEAYREANIELPGSSSTLEELVNKVAKMPLICQPGSQWNYSVSTDVLGRLVEVWSGQTLEEYFRSEIIQPLGMHNTGFHVGADKQQYFASLYAPLSGGDMSSMGKASLTDDPALRGGLKLEEAAKGSRFLKPPGHCSGGGGLTSTIGDYARFCQMLLNKGELEGVRLLGRKTVEYMGKNHLPGNCDMAAMGQPVWSETSYDGIGFGLGFAVVIDPVKAHIVTSVGEYHWGGAASTFFWIDPEEELFVVFFTQLIPSSTYPIRRELRTRVYQALVD